MRRAAGLLVAVLALAGCASRGPEIAPVPPASLPAERPAAAGICAHVAQHLQEWAVALNLLDWRLGYACEPGPAFGAQAQGEVSVDVQGKVARIWVNPRAADAEEVVVHELLHVVLQFVRLANSDLVEEQQLRVLTRLLLQLERRCEPAAKPEG